MFKKLTFCSLLLFSCLPYVAFSSTLHSIIIGDTQDRRIGKSVKLDLPKMKESSKKIAHYTGLNLKETVITGQDCNIKNILNTLESLDLDQDDTVILYYSGHGYRTDNPKDNRWPNMSPPGFAGVNLEYLAEILLNKNPRFILAIADVCNNIITERFAPETLIRRELVDETTIKTNFKKLFVETRAVILASGSSPSEYSYCDEKNGGHFTLYYLRFLNEEVRKKEIPADWDSIFSKAKDKLYKQQKPQYEIIPL